MKKTIIAGLVGLGVGFGTGNIMLGVSSSTSTVDYAIAAGLGLVIGYAITKSAAGALLCGAAGAGGKYISDKVSGLASS